MDNYIARQPIMDGSGTITAYELLYHQDSASASNPRDARAAQTIIQFFNQIDEDSFLDGKDAFLTFPPTLLMQNVPRVFSPDKLVIQIEDDVLVHPVARMIIQRYKRQGYRLAIMGFQFNSRFMNMLGFVDILKINFADFQEDKFSTYLSIAKEFGLKLAAYNVNTPQAREWATKQGFDYIQGSEVAAITQSRPQKALEHLQANFFQLMAAVTREEPDLDEIAELIRMDVTLTFSLLKLVNSSYFALPNRVKDVKQALTILGLGQLRQWIYLLSFNGDESSAAELIKLSFQRAVFCQELVELAPDFPITAGEGYMLGMFSTLDQLLGVSLEKALSQLPISDMIKEALISKTGPCSTIYELSLAYEQGQWNSVSRLAGELNIPLDAIAQKYLQAVDYVTVTWANIISPFDATSAQSKDDSAN